MTLYHFGNCLALVYVPYYLTYKYSGLSEYGAFWKCIQAGGIYIFTQLIKMLALATFFPTADNVGENGFDVLDEFLKSSIDLADLVGILLVLNGIPGKGHAKILTAGIGWAGAENLIGNTFKRVLNPILIWYNILRLQHLYGYGQGTIYDVV
ncbi:hypothetical protein KM043_013301 [Ampulex compressa]|nr:hypothetical protein KM043_013301 [Ampulex compressa]